MSPYAKFLLKKAITLAITVVIAAYITVVIANLGGIIDQIIRAEVENAVRQQLAKDPTWQKMSPEEKEKMFKQRVEIQLKARGYYDPVYKKYMRYLWEALSLNLGRATTIRTRTGSNRVSDIIIERLPWSIALFTSGTVLSAIIGLVLGLYMARKALSVFDRGMTMYAIVINSFPGWFIGILALLVFAYELRWFPTGGIVTKWVGVPWYVAAADFLHHLCLPLICWTFVGFPGFAYVVRSIVIDTMRQDFVLVARAKGVPERRLLRTYVLRPSAPPIVTMIALSLIASWEGAIIFETIFRWRGIGLLYWDAIVNLEPAIIIALNVLYAYLLAITVFILDVLYGYLDPRVRAGGG